ncbi:MAG: serine/threonine protein phosphatase [Ruminococcaceae bacterium]|nr:serine/threonine protein phosphatase [Oscillospiraceae bacterium]
MSVFVIGDLHLSLAVNKPMDLFGGVWNGYVEKILAGWQAAVAPEDTVILAGDTSWGMSLEEALEDFKMVEALPGKKLLLKGNHDYFWTTVTGMRRFLAEQGLETLDFIHNTCCRIGDVAYCGTRGWFQENGSEIPGGKVYNREVMRLKASLEEGKQTGAAELVAILHYPPLFQAFRSREMLDLLQAYGVKRCYYGHLHGKSLRYAFEGDFEGVSYRCISADRLNFQPYRMD